LFEHVNHKLYLLFSKACTIFIVSINVGFLVSCRS